MGGGNSIEANQRAVTSTLAQIVVSSLQSASSEISLDQTIEVFCDNLRENLTRSYLACQKQFGERDGSEIIKLCAALAPNSVACGGNDIVWNQAVVATINVDMKSKFEENIENNLKTNLTAKLLDNSGLLQFGNKTKIDIEALITAVSKIDTESIQEAFVNSNLKQKLLIQGGFVEVLNFDQSVNIISDIVLKTNNVTKLTQDVAQDIYIEQKQSDLSRILIYTGIAVGSIVLLIIIGVVVRYFKKRGKKSSSADDSDITIRIGTGKKRSQKPKITENEAIELADFKKTRIVQT